MMAAVPDKISNRASFAAFAALMLISCQVRIGQRKSSNAVKFSGHARRCKSVFLHSFFLTESKVLVFCLVQNASAFSLSINNPQASRASASENFLKYHDPRQSRQDYFRFKGALQGDSKRLAERGLNFPEKRAWYTQRLPLDKVGLEISPYFNPLVLKSEHEVYYTDHVSYHELIKKAELQPDTGPDGVVPIDFVWKPGQSLKESAPSGLRFDYAVSSNVVEHTANTIKWVADILEVIKPGGVLLLIAPHKNASIDQFRPKINVADLIDAWLRDIYIPSPRQVFEYLSHSFDMGKPHKTLEASVRSYYTDEKAMEFAVIAATENTYLDVHTFSYTPEEFVSAFRKIADLGLLNVDVSDPEIGFGGVEFLVSFTKKGEPDTKRYPYLDRVASYHEKLRSCRQASEACLYKTA